MDNKLLDALNNLSNALELLAQTLSNKDVETSSPVTKALSSGNFIEEIKNISEGIKKLREDNKKILKNQETIIALSKKKETDKKLEPFEKVGDKNMKELIKSGVAIIMIIAAGVLAIGMAFKLVGKIDILSVIGLSISIVLISIAFEKVAKLNLTVPKALETSAVMVLVSMAITLSSHILRYVMPISIGQSLTIILIASTFTAISYGLHKMAIGVLNFKKSNVSVKDMSLILLGISAVITLSSWVLSLVKPISISQSLTAILIASTFAVVGYSLDKIAKGVSLFEKSNVNIENMVFTLVGVLSAIVASSWVLSLVRPISISQALTTILIAGTFAVVGYSLDKIAKGVSIFENLKVDAEKMVYTLVGISTAIMASSWILSLVKPISPYQVLTALSISLMFAIMSPSFFLLALGVNEIDKKIGVSKLWIMPLVFVAISIAVALSSHILSYTVPVSSDILYNILIMSSVLSISALTMGFTSFVLAKIGIGNIVEGGIAILIMSGVIMATSLILNLGKYDTYPSLDWGLGVSLSITTFAILSTVIGALAMTGIGFAAMLAGMGTILTIAGTIVAVSQILSLGNYSYGNDMLPWAKSVSLLYLTFTPIIMILGTAGIIGSIMSLFGANPFKKAKEMLIDIAETIVEVSNKLAIGNYKSGPNPDWARSVSNVISTFSNVYLRIQESSGLLSIFKGNVADDFKNAILTIADGIIEVAKKFNDNKVSFAGSYPSREWSEGVGLAVESFAPVFKIVNDKGLINSILGNDKGEEVKTAMVTIADSIIEVAKRFNENSGIFNTTINPDFIKNLGSNISDYIKLSKDITKELYSNNPIDRLFNINNPIDDITRGLIKLGGAYNTLSNSIRNFGNSINNIDVEKLSAIRSLTSNVILMSLMDPDSFEEIMKKLEENAGIFNDIINNINESQKGTKVNVLNKQSEIKKEEDDRQKMIISLLSQILNRLNSISKDSSVLAEYTYELRTSQGIKIKK